MGNRGHRLRIVTSFVVGFLVVLADPHAVFFTAVAQQQLFFNVLAALDQADYVETEVQRLQLVAQREAATETTTSDGTTIPGFGPETFPGITSTQATGFSGVLSRLLTLEGNDLYTDFLYRTFALEVTRRNALSDLFSALCVTVFGRDEGCYEPQLQDALSIQRAYVSDPKRAKQGGQIYGVRPSLTSGVPETEQWKEDYYLDFVGDEVVPHPILWDSGIDETYSNAAATGSDAAFAAASFLTDLASELLVPPVPVTAFADPDLVRDALGNVVDITVPSSVTDPLGYSMNKLLASGGLRYAALAHGLAHAEEFESYRGLAQSSGQQADNNLLAIQGVDGTIADVEGRFPRPAGTKNNLLASALDSVPAAENSTQYVVPSQEQLPGGNQELLRRNGSVNGAQIEASDQGSVLGIFDERDPAYHSSLGVSLPANVSSVPVFEEQTPAHLLIAAGVFDGIGGCGCAFHSVVGSFGGSIQGAISN